MFWTVFWAFILAYIVVKWIAPLVIVGVVLLLDKIGNF